jgi:3alpha(or 20beta)-hydroxysteroid dehydrogenase
MVTLDNKVALVTGAARGQGECVARCFARLNAHVLVTDVLDEVGSKVAADIGELARYAHLDVTDENQWQRAVDDVVAQFGRLDILVNNAGVLTMQAVTDESLASFRHVLDVNLVGAFLGIRAAVPIMRRAGGGSIINISSAVGLVATAYSGAYAASKWGLRGLTKAMALELGGYGIRVNSIHPGIIDTPMVKDIAPPSGPGNYPAAPLRRIGKAHETASLIAYLGSDSSSYITGAEIAVDGGFSAGPTPPRF